MITVKKREEKKRRNVNIEGRSTCERTSPEPRCPNLGTLKDHDEVRQVH